MQIYRSFYLLFPFRVPTECCPFGMHMLKSMIFGLHSDYFFYQLITQKLLILETFSKFPTKTLKIFNLRNSFAKIQGNNVHIFAKIQGNNARQPCALARNSPFLQLKQHPLYKMHQAPEVVFLQTLVLQERESKLIIIMQHCRRKD